MKLMKHYATNGTVKARVRYSRGQIKGRDCVTLYAKDYGYDLDKVFPESENGSDMMTDYFEKSRVRIFEDSPLFSRACELAH